MNWSTVATKLWTIDLERAALRDGPDGRLVDGTERTQKGSPSSATASTASTASWSQAAGINGNHSFWRTPYSGGSPSHADKKFFDGLFGQVRK